MTYTYIHACPSVHTYIHIHTYARVRLRACVRVPERAGGREGEGARASARVSGRAYKRAPPQGRGCGPKRACARAYIHLNDSRDLIF